MPRPLTIALCLSAAGVIGCSTEPSAAPPPAPATGETEAAEPIAPSEPDDGLVADDGRTLWASPTAGEPIDLSLVPDGSGLFLYARPRQLFSTEEGLRVWRALGPAGDDARAAIEAVSGKPLTEVETLTVGVAPGESYEQVAVDLRTDPPPSDDLPLLQRAFEQLLETTDRDRLVTLVFSPRFLLGDGDSMLRGPWAPLRDLLLEQLRDEWAAASLSLHLDGEGRLYWEARLIGNAREPESQAARALARQAGGWGTDAEGVVEPGAWSAYSTEVIRRSPAMWELVGRYARPGTDGRQAVVNGYAPAGAAHNLLLAGERIVSELAAPVAAEAVAAAEPDAASVAERLERSVTISFRRESLETAVTILSESIGVPITITGRDLQLQGITRNQMLALDVTDTPAAAALVEVLRRANPDPLAEGPDDPRQQLVYVVEGQSVRITTRAAAEQRGDTLPATFRVR